LEELLLKSIYHDIPEAITGDIITPTKRAIPGFVEILEKVELQMMEDYMFDYISVDYKNYISSYIFHPFDDEL
jgi:putative hydrolase of HD superfamily